MVEIVVVSTADCLPFVLDISCWFARLCTGVESVVTCDLGGAIRFLYLLEDSLFLYDS